jgi:hypothetical protein
MIYFLVNNNYHLDLDIKLAKQLTNYELGLIQVPYSLNIIKANDTFLKIHHFPDKINISIRNPFKIFSIQIKVAKEINPKSTDFLLVHTEMDLLNQYIIQIFYKAKAKIYLLEDGTATMNYYNIIPKPVSIKDQIREFILKKCYNFKYTEIKKYGIETIPIMKDFMFSGVIVNFGTSIKRKIPLLKLTPLKEYFEIIYKNGAIFFNQGLYLWYLKEDEYISYIEDLLAISKNFSPFYFKFHPSDTNNIKLSITKIINEKYRNIIIIPETDIAEILIDKYPVQYAITFNSTAALNLINKGIIPIFLNNLFNNSFPDSSFIVFGQFLKSIDCESPSALSDIKPGFCAFPNATKSENTKSLVNILNLHND